LVEPVDHFSQEGNNMGPKTTENLKAAFAGESQAHMKYMIFSDKAEPVCGAGKEMFRGF